jgi:DNA-binding response OmpR family regulator
MDKFAHILLVEDNRMDVTLTLDAFREAKFINTVHVCTNGKDALDYIFGRGNYADRAAYPKPDIVLLDLKLPGVDGFEVLKQVKSTSMVKRTPVIILTSSKEEGDRALTYDLGANSYLVKPVSFDGFLGVVKKIEGYWISLNIGPPEESV